MPSFKEFVLQRRLEGIEPPAELSGAKMSGSGTIVSPYGLILTVAHIAESKNDLKVLYGTKTYDAEVVLRLKKQDILLIRLTDVGDRVFPYLQLANRPAKIGERLLCVSFPAPPFLGYYPKFAETFVASDKGLGGDKTHMQVGLDSAQGASGSAMVAEEDGKVVGVLTSMITQSPLFKDVPSNVSFALKTGTVYDELADYLPSGSREQTAKSRGELVQEVLRASVLVVACENDHVGSK
jgi:S1-C subfamily serine protease